MAASFSGCLGGGKIADKKEEFIFGNRTERCFYHFALFFNFHQVCFKQYNPVGNCMFKVSNRNTRARCEICSRLSLMTLEKLDWRRSGVFNVNFEHISHLVLLFLLLTLRMQMPTGKFSY